MTAKRNRQPAARLLVTGETLATAQADATFVRWALVSPDFKRVLTLLTNERNAAIGRVPVPIKAPSEALVLGITLGYEAALATLAALTEGPPKGPPAEAPADYKSTLDEHDFDSLNT